MRPQTMLVYILGTRKGYQDADEAPWSSCMVCDLRFPSAPSYQPNFSVLVLIRSAER